MNNNRDIVCFIFDISPNSDSNQYIGGSSQTHKAKGHFINESGNTVKDHIIEMIKNKNNI